MSPDWVRKLKRLRRETGDFGPRQRKVSHVTKLDGHLDQLAQLVTEKPDATIKELKAARGVPVGESTVWRALRRLQFTF